MRRWWDRLFVVLIFVIAGGAIYAVWPDEPDRYLPSADPSGRAVAACRALLPASTCRASRAAPRADTNPPRRTAGHDAGPRPAGWLAHRPPGRLGVAERHAMRRSNEGLERGEADRREPHQPVRRFGVDSAALGKDRLIVELPGVSAQTAQDITRPAVLMFCEGLQRRTAGPQGGTGTPDRRRARRAEVDLQAGTCEPDVDANGDVARQHVGRDEG